MKRLASAILTPFVRFVEWLFGPLVPGMDLALGLFATGWGSLMIFKPRLFDEGRFLGMDWMPDAMWVGFFLVLAIVHGIGCARPSWRILRVAGSLLSAWIWLSVCASFLRIEVTTGSIAYAIVGLSALCGGVYLSGQPRKVA